MLKTAYDEALTGLREGGIPIGAALFLRDGTLLGSGHNRRVQDDDASVHAETDAFRKAGRRRDYPECVMVTHALTVLVLLGSGAPIQYRRGSNR
jgi:creatinine deaminase